MKWASVCFQAKLLTRYSADRKREMEYFFSNAEDAASDPVAVLLVPSGARIGPSLEITAFVVCAAPCHPALPNAAAPFHACRCS